ncbi:winged helix-turn-helix transcriptional regulator [Aquisalimonas sp. APHAB1-3]|uniref:winged helix-turn-helix transcriptional regulator n=1 Tax=Aquisalimonas sp. APHAB1-3 TaxID=3402080 RepID=UPI003AAEA6F4
MPSDELRYALLKALRVCPETNQRTLAVALGVSVGRINVALRQLADSRLVKVTLGPSRRQRYEVRRLGLYELSALTGVVLERKLRHKALIEQEIDELRSDLVETRQALGEGPDR